MTILINSPSIILHTTLLPSCNKHGSPILPGLPSTPRLPARKLPSQKGKVFIVTGATSGIGFKVAKILYAKGGKVYIAGRSQKKGQNAIEAIQRTVRQSEGALEFLPLNLDDLATIKDSVNVFQSKESRLNLLINNAGVSQPPLGSVSKQKIFPGVQQFDNKQQNLKG